MLKHMEENHCDLTEGSFSVFSWRYWEKPRKECVLVFCYFEVLPFIGIFKEAPCILCFYRNVPKQNSEKLPRQPIYLVIYYPWKVSTDKSVDYETYRKMDIWLQDPWMFLIHGLTYCPT